MKVIKRLPESELEIMQIIWKEAAPVSRLLKFLKKEGKKKDAPTIIIPS